MIHYNYMCQIIYCWKYLLNCQEEIVGCDILYSIISKCQRVKTLYVNWLKICVGLIIYLYTFNNKDRY